MKSLYVKDIRAGEKIIAKLHADYDSGPKARWQATIELLDEDTQEMCIRVSAGTMPGPERRIDVPRGRLARPPRRDGGDRLRQGDNRERRRNRH
mgnify:CR=1 FL=1